MSKITFNIKKAIVYLNYLRTMEHKNNALTPYSTGNGPKVLVALSVALQVIVR
jgi:hypothetical protein